MNFHVAAAIEKPDLLPQTWNLNPAGRVPWRPEPTSNRNQTTGTLLAFLLRLAPAGCLFFAS